MEDHNYEENISIQVGLYSSGTNPITNVIAIFPLKISWKTITMKEISLYK